MVEWVGFGVWVLVGVWYVELVEGVKNVVGWRGGGYVEILMGRVWIGVVGCVGGVDFKCVFVIGEGCVGCWICVG